MFIPKPNLNFCINTNQKNTALISKYYFIYLNGPMEKQNISHPPYWHKSKRLALPHAGEDVGQRERLNAAWKQLGAI